ncbi:MULTISPECIES: lysophospholipid acyltransferase family protein [unclassified Bartonella]|uniref:lysophospholipid acyltransferase family protein n=1 Tax=unclassified Bartonella TaxID=2645622 RepID=UPI0015FA738F|nr:MULTISPECIES: 1-acyl-sn-glycerol-3-phosphate acyltransferase [unclassified Bartonella]UXN03438.1 1-acyl-sn-glycerol-3-phosphate acyltransferase [Bartonella sp. HY406]UXN06408.1 1-acyl-sn-glycerol-3-phosphate acyltransferase [Bartonella sp. HY761]
MPQNSALEKIVLFIRSILFIFAFYTASILQVFLYTPFYFFLPRKKAWIVPKIWGRVTMFLFRHIVGTNYRLEGMENIPKGACIIAPKHQSMWETIMLCMCLEDPSLVLKRELMRLPIFGWFMWKIGMIPIDRGSPIKAMKAVINGAREKAADGRQIVIFPEGTRQEPGAEPSYKPGIIPIYSELSLPVIPIALNAGLFWPRSTVMRYPGTVIMRVLPAIEPGLNKREFLKKLEEVTEKACDDLLIEAANSKNPPAMPQTAVKRLAELGIDWQGQIR